MCPAQLTSAPPYPAEPARSPAQDLADLTADFEAGVGPALQLSWGHNPLSDDAAGQVGPWVLSQWWPQDFQVAAVAYRHAEMFMMAEKARLFGDEQVRAEILTTASPKDCKSLGRQVHGFDQVAWDAVCFQVVLRGSWAKFTQSPPLAQYLLSTAPAVLAEASPYDDIWGIKRSPQSPCARDARTWRGRNLLGFALIQVRDRLSSSG